MYDYLHYGIFDTNDYEEAILSKQEAICDDCSDCPYAGVDTCKNQCMEEEIFDLMVTPEGGAFYVKRRT